jgi:hypothetical protein
MEGVSRWLEFILGFPSCCCGLSYAVSSVLSYLDGYSGGKMPKSGEWAAIRDELHRITVQRDALISQIIQVRDVLRENTKYDRGELIEELEGIVE